MTKRKDVRRIAFMNALYRVKTGGHIQTIVSGEFNHGKSTTAILLMKYDTIYTRELLKKYKPEVYDLAKKHLVVSSKTSIIVSPEDPASKYIFQPQLYRPYEIDEGYLWATTQEASEKKTKQIREWILKNRKKCPSFYWVYPNMFKVPGILLELMMEVIHKVSLRTGVLLIPSTVIQIKEKFAKEKIEKYAKKPRLFTKIIRYHPSFIYYPKFPKLKGQLWENYLKKYEKYAIAVGETEKKKDPKEELFAYFDNLVEKRIIEVKTKDDIKEFMKTLLESNNKYDENLLNTLVNEYYEYRLKNTSERLLKNLKSGLLKLNIDNLEGE
ncbi:MAG: hypothetical protein ACP5HJ_01720 [Candidatus Micrarchaeia archaeon]